MVRILSEFLPSGE